MNKNEEKIADEIMNLMLVYNLSSNQCLSIITIVKNKISKLKESHFLDKTDLLSISQQRFVLNYINKKKDKLRRFEKFSIFSLTENTYVNPEPIFSKCNPGTGKNSNKLYQNPKKIQMKFDRFFSRPLKENMKSVLSDGVGSQSPIFEMIRELSFRDDFGEDVKQRTLIIISDMMHHTPQYSQYSAPRAHFFIKCA